LSQLRCCLQNPCNAYENKIRHDYSLLPSTARWTRDVRGSPPASTQMVGHWMNAAMRGCSDGEQSGASTQATLQLSRSVNSLARRDEVEGRRSHSIRFVRTHSDDQRLRFAHCTAGMASGAPAGGPVPRPSMLLLPFITYRQCRRTREGSHKRQLVGRGPAGV
jgi:hypothetical protein